MMVWTVVYYVGGILLGEILAAVVSSLWTTARGWGVDDFLVEGMSGFFTLGMLLGGLLRALVGRRCATAMGVSMAEFVRRRGLLCVGLPLGVILGLVVTLVTFVGALYLRWLRSGRPGGDDGGANEAD